MAYITPIGADPRQIDYRLTGGHGCDDPDAPDHQFSYRTQRERPLWWIGQGLAEVGLHADTELTDDQFDTARTLMRGQHPGTGEQLVHPKVEIPHDAKLPVTPLIRAVHDAAREAQVTIDDILRNDKRMIKRFAAAEQAIQSKGELARLRADEAGELARVADIPISQIWEQDAYDTASANLWTVRSQRQPEGTTRDVREPRRTVVGNRGYDITLTLPKSYSVLLAFAHPDLAHDVIEPAYLTAVRTAFAWLEDTTAYGMRGHHGDGQTARIVKTSGYLGWAMIHRTARPADGHEVGDPHWHTHISIANMARGDDGKWSTVAAGGRDLMRHANAIDHITKALVRERLRRTLPAIRYYRNPRTGAWEVAGIEDATLRTFSQRNTEIRNDLTAMGVDPSTATRADQRKAEQRSRNPRTHTSTAPDATLQDIWHTRERAAGRNPDTAMQRVLHRGRNPDPQPTTATPRTPQPWDNAPHPDTPPDPAAIARQLQDPDTGLTAHGRRFSRADALARVADAMPYGAASVADIEALTDAVLRQPGFVALDAPGAVRGPQGDTQDLAAGHMANAQRYTTRDIVAAEEVVLSTAAASRPDQSPATITDPGIIAMAIATVEAADRFDLADEQRAAVTRLLTEGRALDSVEGVPGSGKTTLMRVLRVAMEKAGHVVGGAATAAVAAQNLHTESGIPARTVASILTALDNDAAPLAGVDLLVLDEANLTDDRDRARVYRHAADTGTRIVEIGDRKQLRGVGAGSLFGLIHDAVGGAELRENRRQREHDEREALAAWREGRYHEALTIWADKVRLVATDTADEATAAMLTQWWAARQGAPDPHAEIQGLVMLAATNAQVDRYNAAAQALRRDHHELGEGHTYRLADGQTLDIHVGDHVLLRVNDTIGQRVTGEPVLNGYRGVVTAIEQSGDVTVEWQDATPDGTEIRTAHLSPDYVAFGGVRLGYALTVHKAEGLTVKQMWEALDQSLHGATVLFHADGADNPALYVALSRHRQDVYLYASRAHYEDSTDAYYLGNPRSRAELIERLITALAEHARDTETHADDRPVLADLHHPLIDHLGLGADLDRGLDAALTEATLRERADRATQRAERAQARVEREARAREYAADREQRARERAAREQRDHERQQVAAGWLRAAWADNPTLVQRLTAADGFLALARNLLDAVEASYDLDEVLDQLPQQRIAGLRLDDPAAYAAVMVDIAVDRLRSGHAARDAQRDADREAFAQLQDQAGDLVREAWARRLDVAETVIASPAFRTLTRTLDQLVDTDLDLHAVLRAVPLAKLDNAARDPGAYAVYLVRRVADRQLADLEVARDRAEAQAARAVRHVALADLARDAWRDHGSAVDAVLGGPSARWLLEDLDRAQTAGYDLTAALTQVDVTRLTRPDVRSPSGAATFALRRVLAAMPTPPALGEREPVPGEQPAPPVAAGLEPLPTQSARPPEVAAESPSTPEPAPDWTQRPFGQMTDTALHDVLSRARQQAEHVAHELDAATQRAQQVRDAAAAEHGPQVTAVESHRQMMRDQAALVAEADHVEATWQATVQRARTAAVERTAAEQERDALSRRARARRPDLDARITELQAVENQAREATTALASRAAHLQRQLGDRRDHIPKRLAAVERDYPHARELAQRRDLAAAEAAGRSVQQLTARQQELADHAREVAAELDLREHTPADLREIDNTERATTSLPGTAPERLQPPPSIERSEVDIPLTAEVQSAGPPEVSIEGIER